MVAYSQASASQIATLVSLWVWRFSTSSMAFQSGWSLSPHSHTLALLDGTCSLFALCFTSLEFQFNLHMDDILLPPLCAVDSFPHMHSCTLVSSHRKNNNMITVYCLSKVLVCHDALWRPERRNGAYSEEFII